MQREMRYRFRPTSPDIGGCKYLLAREMRECRGRRRLRPVYVRIAAAINSDNAPEVPISLPESPLCILPDNVRLWPGREEVMIR